MAIYRLNTTIISRSHGKSAIASAAYRSGEKLYDRKLDKEFDYTKKLGVDGSKILLPENADDLFSDREELWNKVEESETRRNSQLAREVTLSLPTELSNEQKKELVEKFCVEKFTSKGLACDIAYHHLNSKNPHCHIMTTTREIEGAELTKKARWANTKDFLIDLRKDWEVSVNRELERNGIDHKVSCESYRSRGLNITGLSAKFNDYDRTYVERLKQENTAEILKNIDVIPSVLTDNKAVINDYDITKFVERNVSEEYISEVKEKIYESLNLVELEKGKYTSLEYLGKEKNLFENLEQIDTYDKSKIIESKFIERVSFEMGLSQEQERALEYVTSEDSNIKNIQGYAGSGKSYTVKAIAKVYEQSGFKNRGLALSGVVADNLSKDCDIANSSTIASFINSYENGYEKIDNKTVVFVDEASLVGTSDYEKITSIVKDNGAKLVNVGDDNQASAISAGGASRAIFNHTSSCTLSENRRQKDQLDKKATYDFSTGKTENAIRHYHDKGSIKYHATQEEMYESIVSKYIDNLESNKSSLALATKNEIVETLNLNIQNTLKENGYLGEQSFTTKNKEFYEKDRLVFLSNSRDLNVKNGSIGTIERIKGNEVQVLLDGKEQNRINFNIKDYKNFDLGYSLTVHKSQGVTVDDTQLYLDKDTNKNLTLVGCTRHRENLTIHCSKDLEKGIANLDQLIEASNRKSTKDLVSDYEYKITKQYIDKTSNLPNSIKQGRDLEQVIKLDIAIKQQNKELDIAKANMKVVNTQEERMKLLDDITDKQKAIISMTKTKELYSNNIENDMNKSKLESEYKDAFKDILDKDKKLKLEAKREAENIKTLEQIIKLDNQAKQVFKEAKNMKITNYKDFADFNAQAEAKKAKELESKDLFDKRNNLLKEFDKYKDMMSDKVKSMDSYNKVQQLNTKQLEYSQKEISNEKSLNRSLELEGLSK